MFICIDTRAAKFYNENLRHKRLRKTRVSGKKIDQSRRAILLMGKELWATGRFSYRLLLKFFCAPQPRDLNLKGRKKLTNHGRLFSPRSAADSVQFLMARCSKLKARIHSPYLKFALGETSRSECRAFHASFRSNHHHKYKVTYDSSKKLKTQVYL